MSGCILVLDFSPFLQTPSSQNKIMNFIKRKNVNCILWASCDKKTIEDYTKKNKDLFFDVIIGEVNGRKTLKSLRSILQGRNKSRVLSQPCILVDTKWDNTDNGGFDFSYYIDKPVGLVYNEDEIVKKMDEFLTSWHKRTMATFASENLLGKRSLKWDDN